LKLDLTNDALGFVEKLEAKQHKQVTNKLFGLMKDPRPHDSIEMKNSNGYFRTDIGEFRIIYKFDKDTVYVSTIGRRNDGDVYALFDRKNKK
jgi:mRNA interferase RelE/StbE